MKKNKRRVCYVLAYKDPNYVRTKVLLKALEHNRNNEVIQVINTATGILRYPQVVVRLMYIRITQKPDVYVLGFRGHEVLPFIRLATIGKPLIFDEFIVLSKWLSDEHKKISKKSLTYKIITKLQRWLLISVSQILSDTEANARSSSRTYQVPLKNYRPVFVGTDESLFKPRRNVKKSKRFHVFYYGTGLPLHGFEYVLESARRLRKNNIHFTIITGKNDKLNSKLNSFLTKHSMNNVTLIDWVPFDALPDYIHSSDICLGGPFGKTPQANVVITGKTFQFMACGAPTVIGRNLNEKLFTDKVNCLMCDRGSADSVERTIIWAYKNKSKLASIGKSGRLLYEKEFSNIRIAKRMREIIDEVS